MKTITTYSGHAKRAKAILIAGLIFIQAALLASDSSDVKQAYINTGDAYPEYAEKPNAQNAENVYYELSDTAFEAEMEIEDWMCNIHNDSFNYNLDEEEIELEEWMYNTQHIFWKDLDEAEEPELAIEDWMTNPDEWFKFTDEVILSSK